MYNIAIFASGSGTNAQKIIEYFESNKDVNISLVLSNKPQAKVLERAKKFDIPSVIFDRNAFYESDEIIRKLQKSDIDLIILAGFLWLVPKSLIEAFPQRIINIHPALLPKYGGKGMYGSNVHKAVFEAKEKESGITIHYVNEEFDEGKIIFQEACPLTEKDTPQSIAEKVQVLEHKYFPKVVENLLETLK